MARSTVRSVGMPTDARLRFDSMLPTQLRDAFAGFERRQAVRAPTGLRFAFADSLSALNATAWDEVTTGKGLMVSGAYLEALEGVVGGVSEPSEWRSRGSPQC